MHDHPRAPRDYGSSASGQTGTMGRPQDLLGSCSGRTRLPDVALYSHNNPIFHLQKVQSPNLYLQQQDTTAPYLKGFHYDPELFILDLFFYIKLTDGLRHIPQHGSARHSSAERYRPGNTCVYNCGRPTYSLLPGA
jgi:hypothetical protein